MREKLERLAAAGIEAIAMPGLDRHAVFARDGFAALVELTADGFGSSGSAGLVTDRGFAVLVWRGGRAYFVARGHEQAATPEHVESLRAFTRDLDAALRE